ncbi:MAG: S8 family serine peptidase, partial [Halobaculum sp.]
ARIDADAANLSLGAYPIPRQGLGQFYGKALNRIMTFANKEGTLLVIAAGNDAANLQQDKNLISLPNEGAQGVSVAATGPEGFTFGPDGFDDPPESPAFYTNYGTNAVDLGAPGGDLDFGALAAFRASGDGLTSDEIRKLIGDWVLSTTFDATGTPRKKDLDGDGDTDIVTNEPTSRTPRYGYKLGTSMAAPQVAGAAALVKSANPSYNANQVESALKRAADVPDGYDKRFYGSGFVNVVDAL